MSERSFSVGARVRAADHKAKEMVGTPFESQYHFWQAARGTVVELAHDVWPASDFQSLSLEDREAAYAEGRWVRVAWDHERLTLAKDRMLGVLFLKSDLAPL